MAKFVSGRPLVLAALALVPIPSLAKDGPEQEFWPELDIFYRLAPRRRLVFAVAPTNERATRDRSEMQVSLGFDYVHRASRSYRITYSYLASGAELTRTVENRISMDYTHRWLFGKALIYNRSRVELRDINDRGSFRLRNRSKLEYFTRIGTQIVTFYGTAEAFFDSRYDQISRFRFELGVSTLIARNAELELNFGRQVDPRTESSIVNGIGLILNLYY